VNSAINVVLLHLEIRYAVPQQSTNSVVSFKYGNRVACACELLGGSEASGPTPDNGDCFTCEAIRHLRQNKAFVKCLINYAHLNFFDGDCWLVYAENACILAGRWTNSTSKLRKIISCVKSINCFSVSSAMSEIIPLWN
jgi:hypothetical protein